MSLEFTIIIGVPGPVLYKALLSEFEMSKTTRTKANIVPQIGGQFDLYEGRISGSFKALEPDTKITQLWKMSDWKEYSTVEMTIIDFGEDEQCQLTVKQTGLPGDMKPVAMEQGWMSQIFRPMSMICGFPILNK